MVANYVFKDVYKFYQGEGGDLDYKLFREICVRFNSTAMDEMIYHGRTLDMGSGLSTLSVAKTDLDYERQRIDWGASKKLKKQLESEGKALFSNDNPEGHKWLVYYTYDSFIHFYWCKTRCRVDNKKVYRFNATRGETGNKTKLKTHLKSNLLAHTRYDRID